MTGPVVLGIPAPRRLDLIFRPAALARLRSGYDLHEAESPDLPAALLARVRYLIGQPPLSAAQVEQMTALRCIFNVEGNFLDNLPYPDLFRRGIHVVTPGSVFAVPVAELGLGLALDLLRGITEADLAFRRGHEVWGLEGNRGARLLSGAEVGLVGFGDLGRALYRLLGPFGCRVRIHDPWLPPSVIAEAGAEAATLDGVMRDSDVVFVLAGVTAENRGFLDAAALALMRPGAAFVLLSRADVVDFDALAAAVGSGRIVAASDVFPHEPMPPGHPLRSLPGFLRSAHRAGALEQAFFRMGDYLLEDMALLDRGLPPQRCRRAERETVGRLRSRPVALN